MNVFDSLLCQYLNIHFLFYTEKKRWDHQNLISRENETNTDNQTIPALMSMVFTHKQQGNSFQNVILFFHVVPYNCDICECHETGPIHWIFSKHCGYWWSGALAPGHQYPQCWICISSSLWVNINRASVSKVLNMYLCISSYFRVNVTMAEKNCTMIIIFSSGSLLQTNSQSRLPPPFEQTTQVTHVINMILVFISICIKLFPDLDIDFYKNHPG